MPSVARRALAALSVLAILSPAASAFVSTNDVWYHRILEQGNQWDRGHASSGKLVKDGCCGRIEGNGWIEFDYALHGPDGIGFDRVRVVPRVYDLNTGNYCRAQLYDPSGSVVYDTQSAREYCFNDWAWSVNAYESDAGTYRLRIACGAHCWHIVEKVNVDTFYNGFHLEASNPYPSHSVTGGRLPIELPAQCLTVTARGSPSHDTRVEIDWGDGTSVDARTLTSAWADGERVCHTYLLPQTIPYQVCIRLKETNGLERTSPNVCKDVPGVWVPL